MADAQQQQQAWRVVPGPEVEDFANALDLCLSRESEQRQYILDLPRKFHEIASRRLAAFRPLPLRDGQDDIDMDADDADSPAESDEVKQLRREVQTWDLFRRLLPLRYSPKNTKLASPAPPAKARQTPKEIVEAFWEADPLAKERRAVLKWLQNSARDGPDIDELVRELQQSADRGDIIAHGWLHTRSAIKLRKSVTAWPHLLDRQSDSISKSHLNAAGAPLVTQLDPDAVTRQARKLEPQDDYFERAIWMGCYQHLRRGSNFLEIRDWCSERTEMWRAVSMSAIVLSADDQESVMDTTANSLALWRRMCFSLARQGGCDDYERAVYGILSGDLPTVEKVAMTWDDHLFANYNALLRTQLDNYLLAQCPSDAALRDTQSLPAFDAVQFHGDPKGAEQRIIRSLEKQESVRRQALEPNKALQAAFIAKDIELHLREQGLALGAEQGKKPRSIQFPTPEAQDRKLTKASFFSANQHTGLRLVAHVYLVIALLDRFEDKPVDRFLTSASKPAIDVEAHGNIIAAYTDYLRLADLKELIPLYCSILEPAKCYEVLSTSVLQEATTVSRMEQLRLISKAGISVNEFVKTQATLMYENLGPGSEGAFKVQFKIVMDDAPRYGRRVKPDFFNDDEHNVDEKDERAIKSLEYLLLVEATWPQAFAVGVQVYKHFLGNMQLNSARELMQKVDFISIVNHMVAREGFDEAWLDDVEFWAQQLEDSGIKDLDPRKVMRDARVFRGLESLVKALDNLETIASFAQIDAEPGRVRRGFWEAVSKTTVSAGENMGPLLRNWLVPEIEEGDKELERLRKLYLTETVLAYVSTLHFAGARGSRDHLLECMDLAAVVAERNSDLAQSFVEAKRMKELVEAFAGVSKALATAAPDKKSGALGSKKLREMGWSRDIWSVNS
ncbi:hypothetical protein S7711_08084 [Stachybotrys chartarum IBT 7711]|uniref:Nuclear pore complex protein n=1 Tax=Stachybotrys chartarum (strain CBS 109288 / IBT 7711) TaxID=1280523 RepID=A0A084B236_STACB|nr:hypothetical protein S7711_08084 [Stachybotrys chartarum IBT 7711]KFA51774.1 hypothetical protein S40293_05902 [Stachybotrys chartarum IBT 40293]